MSDGAVETLAKALHSALLRDLPPVSVAQSRHGAAHKRRPHESEVEVIHFAQQWENTAIGLDADITWAGQAFTNAYTTVVVDCHHNAAVYFGGHRAYVAKLSARFMADLAARNMVRQSEAGGRYTIVGGNNQVARYINPDNRKQGWSGRGRKPKWLADKLAKGAKLADFESMGRKP